MKTKLVAVASLVMMMLYFNGCDDNSVKNPNNDITINLNDYEYNLEEEISKCREKVGITPHFQPYGFNAISISKDKNQFFSFNYSGCIVRIDNDSYKIEYFDLSSIQRPLVRQNVYNLVFSPYDNNLAIILIYEEEKINGEFEYTPKWYYYRVDTKAIVQLKIDSVKQKDFYKNPKLISWLNTSSPGNDKFFFGNNQILNYPSGLIEANPTGLQIAENEEVISVSPDLQKYFTLKENELYLNGRKIPSSEYVYWRKVPISWSDDSKYFLGVGIEANKKAQLNIVYRMNTGSNSTFKIHSVIDITRKFCSMQSPYSFGYDSYCQAVFKSDSSIAMTLFPNLRDHGDLCEIEFNSKLIRKLTNEFSD